MYKSPIEIIYGQAKRQMENDIFRAVQSYEINVDKAELIRALQYDRDQYEKGYADGKAAAEAAKGRWIYNGRWCEFECTHCGGGIGNRRTYPYCPHCGAQMDE